MSCKVHRVRYYNPKPKSINCISYNKSIKHVAIARDDASIEIWDLNYAPFLLKFIPGTEKGSIEALGWVKERLLSTGLGGALLEWDLDKLVLKKTVLLTGYAAWCLDVDPNSTRVAVGTEQGYINLYSVEDDDIVYQKLFDKQEGRILCCKFDNTGNVLVTGSVNSIRVWNVVTGQALSRISARRGGNETIVWCVGALSDNTVVSGDSHGRLTFWDISTGDQIDSYITHKSDILSLVVSEDEQSLYCSGVDPIIVNFVKVDSEKKGQSQWVKNVQRHIHQHDVRGLALQGRRLVSCGVDGYVTLSSYPPKWVQRVPPMPPAPRAAASAARRLLMLRYNDHLEIWKLGTHQTRDNGELVMRSVRDALVTNGVDKTLEPDSELTRPSSVKAQPLKLHEEPLKLASINAKGGKQIRCCDLSPNGELIVYATESDIRMLKLEVDNDTNTTSISRVALSGAPASCDAAAFGADSETLVLHSGGALHWLQADAAAGAVLHTVDTAPHLKASSLLHLKTWTAKGKTYIVAADTSGAIAVWVRGRGAPEHHATLPRYHAVPSALSVDARTGNIVAVYVDQKLIEYNIEQKQFSEWPRTALPPQWYERAAAARGVTSHPARRACVVQDEAALWILDRDAEESNVSPRKKKPTAARANASLRVVPVKYLCDFHWLSADECVSVEMRPERLVARLPPAAPRRCLPYAD